jgi:hypothetical protein
MGREIESRQSIGVKLLEKNAAHFGKEKKTFN